MALRIILDTNAFHGSNFDSLENGPFLRLCRHKKIAPIYPHVVVEEVLAAYAREDRRLDLANRWLPFIGLSTNTICEDWLTIWHEELVRGRGRHARRFMSTAAFSNLKLKLQHIPTSDGWSAWKATQLQRDQEKEKQRAQKSLSSEIRREARNIFKEHGAAIAAAKRTPWSTLARPYVRMFGYDLIRRQIKCWSPTAVANRWEGNIQAYPFFTQFAENMVYIFLHAMLKQNDAIDVNAQPDMDIMTHLLHADIYVTNETKFAKTAFNDVWKPRGKVLMTSAEFDAFILKL